MEFFQQVILGIIQGVFEWLPISSEGFLLLVSSNFFGSVDINLFIRQALFLHLGTFFAALIYFRKDVLELTKGLMNYRESDAGTKKFLRFLFITTIISGVLGLAILNFFDFVNIQKIPFTSTSINFLIGFLLIFTGALQLRLSSAGYRKKLHLKTNDGIFLGFLQGLAVLPGLSRSGLTIFGLLARNFDKTTALKFSFIMSLPIVLVGNIILNFSDFIFLKEMFFGFVFSFIFGLLTIHLLMNFSKRVRFGFFAIFFGFLAILAALLNLL